MGFECPIQTPKSTLYRWMRRWRVDVRFFLCNNFPLLTYFLVRSLNLGEGREKQVRNQVMSGTSGNSLKGWSTRFFVASRTRNFTFPLVTSWWDCAYRHLQLVYQYILARYIFFNEISLKFQWNFIESFIEISIEISKKLQTKFHFG